MKAWCYTCNKNVDYITEPAPQRFGKVKGRYYIYDGETARCSICGHEIQAHEVEEFNIDRLNKKVEEQKCSVKRMIG